MKKLIMTVAIAAMGIAAIAQECPTTPKGPEGGCKYKGPKSVELALDKDLTAEKVEAYKAEVAAKIDEIVKCHNEMVAKRAAEKSEGKCAEGCKCPGCNRPSPKIMLIVGDGRMGMGMGPKGPMGMKHGRKNGNRRPRPEATVDEAPATE